MSTTSSQSITIVESAKTAMMAKHCVSEFIWLATMGPGSLERLRPLRGRAIWLYPDAGAFEKWSQKAESLRRLDYNI